MIAQRIPGGPVAVRFVTVVWGNSFVDGFVRVLLPSRLASGNLPRIAQDYPCTYRVYTKLDDVGTLRRAASFNHLAGLMRVEMAVIDGVSYVGKYRSMNECDVHFVRSWADEDSAFVFLSPDTVWADGSFAHLGALLARDKRLIAVRSCRLAKETFVRALSALTGGGIERAESVLTIAPRDLVKFALAHLHPVTLAQLWSSDAPRETSPGDLTWQVGSDGLLTRQFHLLPLAVRPRLRGIVLELTIDADYSARVCGDARDLHMVEDSDQMCFMDFTGAADTRWLVHSARQTVEDTVRWAAEHTGPMHREFVRHSIRLHWRDFSPQWEAVQPESGAVIEAVLLQLDGRSPATRAAIPGPRRFSRGWFAARVRRYGLGGFGRHAARTILDAARRRIHGNHLRIDLLESPNS
jgi:hypothetical protein